MDRLSLTTGSSAAGCADVSTTTDGGREIGVALPTGMQVEPGQIMWVEDPIGI